MSQAGLRRGRLGPGFTPGHMAVLSAKLSNLKASSSNLGRGLGQLSE